MPQPLAIQGIVAVCGVEADASDEIRTRVPDGAGEDRSSMPVSGEFLPGEAHDDRRPVPLPVVLEALLVGHLGGEPLDVLAHLLVELPAQPDDPHSPGGTDRAGHRGGTEPVGGDPDQLTAQRMLKSAPFAPNVQCRIADGHGRIGRRAQLQQLAERRENLPAQGDPSAECAVPGVGLERGQGAEHPRHHDQSDEHNRLGVLERFPKRFGREVVLVAHQSDSGQQDHRAIHAFGHTQAHRLYSSPRT